MTERHSIVCHQLNFVSFASLIIWQESLKRVSSHLYNYMAPVYLCCNQRIKKCMKFENVHRSQSGFFGLLVLFTDETFKSCPPPYICNLARPVKMGPIYFPELCEICFDTIYAVLLHNLFCVNLRCFVAIYALLMWRKI